MYKSMYLCRYVPNYTSNRRKLHIGMKIGTTYVSMVRIILSTTENYWNVSMDQKTMSVLQYSDALENS
jgi:hypothetical protein